MKFVSSKGLDWVGVGRSPGQVLSVVQVIFETEGYGVGLLLFNVVLYHNCFHP